VSGKGKKMKVRTFFFIAVMIAFVFITAQCSSTPAVPTPGQTNPPVMATSSPNQAAAPAADGKALLESQCTACHALDRITTVRKSAADWTITVNRMVAKGAQVTPDEAQAIIDYLAKTYGQ
jgi:cytochrome c5